MRCKMKGSTNRFCIRFGLHLDLPTHHPSLKFIFLGGIQGKSRGLRYSVRIVPKRISSGAI
jgi:hypothetical protein